MKTSTIGLFLLISLFSYSQKIDWERTFMKSKYDDLQCVKSTSDGGCIFGANVSSIFENNNYRQNESIWVVKLNKKGEKEWDQLSSDSIPNYIIDMEVAKDDIALLSLEVEIGKKRGNDTIYLAPMNKDNLKIRKINNKGTDLWSKKIPMRPWDSLKKMIYTSDGGYLIGGSTRCYDTITSPKTFKTISERLDFLKNKVDIVLYKINSKGDVEWRKTYGFENTLEFLDCISEDGKGGYLLGGSTCGINETASGLLLSIDKSGNVTNQLDYKMGYAGSVIGVVPAKGRGYLVANWGRQDNKKFDYSVTKLDSSFKPLWRKFYGGSEQDNPKGMIQISDSTYLLYGNTKSSDGDVHSGYRGKDDIWLVCIDGYGEILWEKTYGSKNMEWAVDMSLMPDGSLMLGATTGKNVGVLDNDYIRLDKKEKPETITTTASDISSVAEIKRKYVWIVKIKK